MTLAFACIQVGYDFASAACIYVLFKVIQERP